MNHTHISTRGFTLIELLVVLAIIGILLAVVIASVTSTRTKSSDTAVKTQLSNFRSQAELFYTQNGMSYGGAGDVFFHASDYIGTVPPTSFLVDSRIKSIVLTAGKEARIGATPDTAVGVVRFNHNTWAISTDLKGGGAWCVDSVGAVRDRDAQGDPYAHHADAIPAGQQHCN